MMPEVGLDHVVIGGLSAARPALAECRERGIDQPRIDRRERRISEAQRLERAGAVVLHEDIGGCDQLLEDVAIGFCLQVEGDRALVGGLRQEGRAHMAAVERLVGAGSAALVGLVGMLDLDHVGAQHGQLIGGKRPGQNMGDVEHPYALERSRRHRDPLGSADT
jgi:hypothetical protein